MSSANEQLATASKPRISPLDLRNTDLVSRLLAATPPYLYNMSLLPNTYFFSEMLRSLVHAKTESARNALHHRRSRKRPWAPGASDSYHHKSHKADPSVEWLHKSSHTESKPNDVPLELTTNKLDGLSDHSNRSETTSIEKMEGFSPTEAKPEVAMHNHLSLFPSLGHTPEGNSGNVILPPPPPPTSSLWYPPLYPAPYGIDPLHFFIDLRVSGHIYDRKNQKDGEAATSPCEQNGVAKEKSADDADMDRSDLCKDFFKPKHASAFSVPVPKSHRSSKPMNLSSNSSDSPKTKFDVKSMGFEKDSSVNKTSPSYILNNIGAIYKNVNNTRENVKTEENIDHEDLTEEEKQKRDKDLRALIGLDLVVDYMGDSKPKETLSDISTTDTESVSRNDSPALEVVAIPDESSDRYLGSDSYT